MEAAQNSVRCNLCGADDASTVFEAGIAQVNRIVECRQCGLMYSNPRINPADQELIKNYDPEITRKAADYQPDRYEKERLQVRDYDDTRAFLAELYPHRGRLVELGCGMGFLLDAFQQDGWDVLGIEPDRGFCQFIAEHHGLKALPTILEDSSLPDASVDVVVFLHVIEHLPDPLGTLRSIHRLLKPGGHLVVETPRYDSLMFRFFRHRERSVSCDGHIYFFTTDTLRKLCEKAAFEKVRSDYVGRALSLDRLAWNLGVMSKSSVVKNGLQKLSSRLRLKSKYVRLNVFDMQRMVLRKPEATTQAEK